MRDADKAKADADEIRALHADLSDKGLDWMIADILWVFAFLMDRRDLQEAICRYAADMAIRTLAEEYPEAEIITAEVLK